MRMCGAFTMTPHRLHGAAPTPHRLRPTAAPRCQHHQQHRRRHCGARRCPTQEQEQRSLVACASAGSSGGSDKDGASSSSGGGGGGDDAPPVLGDWRAFRARLVQQQQQQQQAGSGASGSGSISSDSSGGGIGGGDDAPLRAGARSEENMALLAAQDPTLAAEDVWAHATPGPERGGLLIATPEAPRVLGSERYWQVVALIVSHDAAGTVALILNRPSGLVLGRKQGGLPFAMAGGPPGLQECFAENRVYCGGFLAQQVIHVLHGHRDLRGSMEIAPGIYCGGENEAVARVAAGELPASSFKFFAGAVAFEPGELEQQLKAGAWYTAAAARPLVLKQVLQLPKPLWREVLGLMGGGYAAVARAAAEEEVDE